MKEEFNWNSVPTNSLLIMCSSHEERCEAIIRKAGKQIKNDVLIFHYKDINTKRDERNQRILDAIKASQKEAYEIKFDESDVVSSFRENINILDSVLTKDSKQILILDISTFVRRHLLMMLQYLTDKGLWDNLCVVYSEPDDYVISKYIPLSFGISSMQEIPGFPATPDMSRPLHLIILLGYEGDRALAVYDQIQPMKTTLVIPYPAYNAGWEGRTEQYNADLIKLVGKESVRKMDALDPEKMQQTLADCLGNEKDNSRVICPLGTKPQTFGMYEFLRTCRNPPAIVYASPLRHNHKFYSDGVGKTWILKRPS